MKIIDSTGVFRGSRFDLDEIMEAARERDGAGFEGEVRLRNVGVESEEDGGGGRKRVRPGIWVEVWDGVRWDRRLGPFSMFDKNPHGDAIAAALREGLLVAMEE